MLWVIFCACFFLALALRFPGRRICCTCAPIALSMVTGPPSARAQVAPIAKTSSFSHSVDGWRTLELWKRAERSRPFCDSPSTPDSGSNIGLRQSIAVSKSDFRLAFTRGSAAVLVGLFQNDDGEIRVILTKRAQSLSSHSGEVALPGGKRDKEDADDATTALREAKEEIGLDPSLVQVLTTVEPFVSKKLLRVTPVIALIKHKSKFMPVPNPGEVDAVFDAPLEMFLKDYNHRYEVKKWFGYTYRLHFFDFKAEDQEFVIWGLTAAILIRCASIIYQKSPAFEELEASSQAGQTPT